MTIRSPLNHNHYFSICYNQAEKGQEEDKTPRERRERENLDDEDVRKQRQRVDMRVCKAIGPRRKVKRLAGIVLRERSVIKCCQGRDGTSKKQANSNAEWLMVVVGKGKVKLSHF